MNVDLIDVLKSYVIPIGAIFLSWFWWVKSQENATKTELILKQINEAVNSWQSDIMRSTTDMLNSSPNIVGSKIHLAKIEAAKSFSIQINKLLDEIATSPKAGDEGKLQMEALNKLIMLQMQYFGGMGDVLKYQQQKNENDRISQQERINNSIPKTKE